MENIYKNILLIAGTGQNVGKTLFASKTIAHFAPTFPVVSIKISPHFHFLDPNTEIITETVDYSISRETNPNGNKDSQRFLVAGSKDVYYIQCHDDKLHLAFNKLVQYLPVDAPIICESGGLRQLIKPGIFLMINKKNNQNIKPQAIQNKGLADKWIEFDESEFDFNPGNLQFSNSGWSIQI